LLNIALIRATKKCSATLAIKQPMAMEKMTDKLTIQKIVFNRKKGIHALPVNSLF